MSTEQHPIVMVDVDLIDIIDQPITEQNDATKQGIMASIHERGLIYEIVVQKQPNGRYTVIDGRTRLEAVRKLGEKYIACKYSEDDPYAPELAYELELYRRALTPEQREVLEKKHYEVKNSIISHIRNDISRRLSPEMRAIYQAMYDKGTLSKEWVTLFWLMAKRPQSEQKAFFDNNTMEANDSAADEIVEELQNKVEELENETKRLQGIEKTMEKVQQGFKARFEEELKIRTEKIREELLETAKEESPSGSVYEAHLEEVRRQVAARYEGDLSEMNSNLRALSKAKQDTQRELDVLKAQMENNSQRSKNYELLLKNKKDEIENNKKIISTLANTSKLIKQLDVTHSDIKALFESFKYIPDNAITASQKNDICLSIDKIIDIAKLIADTVEQKAQKLTA